MDEPSLVQKLTAEVIGTAVLVFIVVGVIHRKAVAGFAGLAIGLVAAVVAALISTTISKTRADATIAAATTGVEASVPAPANATS
ncbi:MAG: hypothetical protein QOG20_5651 [Pseudonocardiales bacterium]|nr:hypothetical protein [Pseudonocardiales bacterium]